MGRPKKTETVESTETATSGEFTLLCKYNGKNYGDRITLTEEEQVRLAPYIQTAPLSDAQKKFLSR